MPFRLLCRALALGLLLTLCVAPAARAQETVDALVYTARVPIGLNLSDTVLKAIAQARGTVEILRFWNEEPLERIIVRLGDEGIGCPGFTSLNRTAAEGAAKSGKSVTQKNGRTTISLADDGAAVEWALPGAGLPFEATISLHGKTIYRETRHEQILTKSSGAAVRPLFIRQDYESGEVVVQVFDWDAPSPTEWVDPYAGFGDQGNKIIFQTDETDPAKAVVKHGVKFRSYHGFQFDWDSGYWPGGGTSPGAFPLQVRLAVGAGWARGGNVQGEFFLDGINSTLSVGAASGDWWVDYGAELSLVAALSIPMLPPITIDIDDLIAQQIGIPTFDMRLQRQTQFSSFLLDSGATISQESQRKQLFKFDIVKAILSAAGVSLPGWIPLSAGVKLDGSIEGVGTLNASSISLSDGTVFTSEYQTQPIMIVDRSYYAVARYNAKIDLSVVLHAYPQLYAEILFSRFDLPLGDLAVPLPLGKVNLEFDECPVSFENIDTGIIPVEGEGTAEGEGILLPEGEEEGWFEEGQPEGEGTPAEGEGTPAEGEGTEEEGEDIPVEIPEIACTTFNSPDGETAIINDLDRTFVSLNIPVDGRVDDLRVGLDIFHPRIADLSVALQSPKGTKIDLFALVGGESANMFATELWDDATARIRNAAGPFGGVFEPFDPLAAFQGENIRGEWRLIINDVRVHNRGVLLRWNLTVNPCATGGDTEGVTDLNEGDPAPEGQTGEGQAENRVHSLDYSPADGVIGLNEVLRCIQFYNVGQYACESGSEDGYKPGDGPRTCKPNAVDYQPANWSISISELLRLIQLYNAGAYHPDPTTEDGFAPGAP